MTPSDFLENANKRFKDFQYLWVTEKQTENKVFKDNIHFHIITNKFWKISRWWQYWLDLQARQGIVPRDENFKSSSAFNVRQIQKDNIRGLVKYLTSYVTKNSSAFDCQVWNCSKRISRLYTAFYSGTAFVDQLRRLEAADLLGGKLKEVTKEWCHILFVPLNKMTQRFYERIHAENRKVWNEGKEVANA